MIGAAGFGTTGDVRLRRHPSRHPAGARQAVRGTAVAGPARALPAAIVARTDGATGTRSRGIFIKKKGRP